MGLGAKGVSKSLNGGCGRKEHEYDKQSHTRECKPLIRDVYS